MAKLNRVRIINFYYNNDIRQIADETFSFYGGQNALINLANGGGKSVLIQLMLQPVIPDHTIQKRTMSSYFKKNTHPAFVLLEWSLDNSVKKDYLLTGIAIAPKITNDENASNSLNYFTFVSHYSQASELDLAYVPFSKKENGKQVILPFEKAREAVRNLANKNSEIFYYGRDDASGYRNKLTEFGISQEEWKNIIAKMNNDEGGIDELFDKCSTSNKLVDEWILKTVEKAVIIAGTENTQVYELIDGLVENTISNEEYIRNENNLARYFIDHKQLELNLSNLCDKIEETDKEENNLNRLYSLLKIESNQLESDLAELQYQKEELDQQLILITKEEKSEKYYYCFETYQELEEQDSELREKLSQLKERQKQLKKELDILKAAKLYKKCQGLQGDINGLLLKLEEQNGDTFGSRARINDLKYSLNMLYQQQIKDVKIQLEDIIKQMTELNERKEQSEQNIETNQKNQNETASDLGAINIKIVEGESYQDKVSKTLGVSFNRNLLGDLIEKEIAIIQKTLGKLVEKSSQVLHNLQCRVDEIKNKCSQNQIDKEILTKDIIDLDYQEKDKQKKKEEYLKEENSCLKIIRKYELPVEDLFNQEELERKMHTNILEREIRQSSSEIELNQMQEMITGIHSGQVYFPKALSEILDREKISFQTGERYLNELSEDKRLIQLKKNCLLPFSIIVEKNDLVKIEKVPFGDAFLRQIIPIFTYENLRNEFIQDNAVISLDGLLKVISSFEPKLFSQEERKNYLLNLEESKSYLEEKIKNSKQELSSLRYDKSILNHFQFDKDYFENLEIEIKRTEQIRKEKECKKEDIKKESDLLVKEQKEKEQLIETSRQLLAEQKRNNELLVEFLDKDKDYVSNLAIRGELLSMKQNIQREIEKEKENVKKYYSEQNTARLKQNSLEGELKNSSKNLSLYEDAKDGNRVEGTIDLLEKEYQSLNTNLEQSFKELENQLNEKKESLKDNEGEIRELNVISENYQNVAYADLEVEILKDRILKLSKACDEAEKFWLEVHDKATKADANLETAHNELSSYGMTVPLPKDEIKQDYVNRRRKIRFEKEEIEKQDKAMQNRCNLCNTRTGIISHLIKPNLQRSNSSEFKLQEDIEKQCQEMERAYKEANEYCAEEKKRFLKQFKEIRTDYKDVHSCITDILNSLDSLDVNNEISYEKVYFYAEELIKKRESLEKLLDFYQQQLATMEDTKRQVIDQCISYATLIYEGIRVISEKSKIKLSNKSRLIQMLKIGIPTEVDSNARSRMKDYIESTLKLLIDYLKKEENGKDKKYKEKIRNMVSTRLLLNQLIGKEQIPVSIYKIELNENNSGMKTWEDAMKQNSGGEKFVCFFTVASTLISYTREATSKRLSQASFNESKVMIMDNPFARTSSEHLLKAVIDIAKTFNIQLICLSDLSQSSITNRFNLIYTLSVRQRLYSDKEVLHIESVQKNREGFEENERLEHVAMYQTFEQGNLFDLTDD